MRRAFQRKDPAYDGTFIVAVKTTGVFCRPVCRAKPPRPQNVEFFRRPTRRCEMAIGLASSVSQRKYGPSRLAW
jgi:methylphosphotriester-DNA--protein-cysteine methyltransferase